MQLTRAADYALRGLTHLARKDKEELCQISDLAEIENVPESFMRKIIHMLSRRGLVRSLRGKNGGITLGENPEEVTMLQVIEAIEGPIILNICLLGPGECDRMPNCAMHEVCAEAQEELMKVLGKYTLADVAYGKEAFVANNK